MSECIITALMAARSASYMVESGARILKFVERVSVVEPWQKVQCSQEYRLKELYSKTLKQYADEHGNNSLPSAFEFEIRA